MGENGNFLTITRRVLGVAREPESGKARARAVASSPAAAKRAPWLGQAGLARSTRSRQETPRARARRNALASLGIAPGLSEDALLPKRPQGRRDHARRNALRSLDSRQLPRPTKASPAAIRAALPPVARGRVARARLLFKLSQRFRHQRTSISRAHQPCSRDLTGHSTSQSRRRTTHCRRVSMRPAHDAAPMRAHMCMKESSARARPRPPPARNRGGAP